MVRGSICIKYIPEVCYTHNPKISFNELSTMNTDGYRTRIYDRAFMFSPSISLCIDEDD